MIIAVENISKRRKDASIELITFHKTFEQYLAFSKIKPTSDANKHITASIKTQHRNRQTSTSLFRQFFLSYTSNSEMFFCSLLF